MANVNAPFGLKPVRYASGAPYNGAFNLYFATGATGAIFPGDPVVAAGSANTAAVQGHAAGTIPTCTVALDGDGDPIIGVCVGVVPVTADSLRYRADSTDRLIMVADDPNLIFIGQSDAASTAFAAVDSGQFGNLLAAAGVAGSAMSQWVLSTASTPGTTVSNQFRFIRLFPRVDNELGAYAIWEVMLNNHMLANVGDAGRFTAV
jgi:hypothetical protein